MPVIITDLEIYFWQTVELQIADWLWVIADSPADFHFQFDLNFLINTAR